MSDQEAEDPDAIDREWIVAITRYCGDHNLNTAQVIEAVTGYVNEPRRRDVFDKWVKHVHEPNPLFDDLVFKPSKKTGDEGES